MKLGLTQYLAIALALSLIGNAWQLHHSGVKSGERAGDIAVVENANAGGQAAVKALQDAVAESYVGRIFDRAEAAKATAVRDAERTTLQRQHDRDVASLAARLAGECRDWAAQPACGVRVR
ncbi:hypothetical protein FHW12_000333 [Dokdonella fugitiva]|uniref:Uncharacterized protein n=1 Tax=Dokdonella fugitiva TaxID=328517 RepID=A0A839EWI7_9GAMM|nr:hypothetical protein [Dokdonella fugitiva]MBA8886142.1 hypothetical protein [Dokdonella fugitiva]